MEKILQVHSVPFIRSTIPTFFLPFLKDNHVFTNTWASTHKKTPVIPSNQLTWCRITNIYSKILQYIPLKAEAISKIFGTEY